MYICETKRDTSNIISMYSNRVSRPIHGTLKFHPPQCPLTGIGVRRTPDLPWMGPGAANGVGRCGPNMAVILITGCPVLFR